MAKTVDRNYAIMQFLSNRIIYNVFMSLPNTHHLNKFQTHFDH